jgi:hypothetical protein
MDANVTFASSEGAAFYSLGRSPRLENGNSIQALKERHKKEA